MQKEIQTLQTQVNKLLEENKRLRVQLILEHSKNLLLEKEIPSQSVRKENFYQENENEYS